MIDEKLKEFYKRYPDLFLEESLGIKLYPYQRILLRMIMKGGKQNNEKM